MVAGPGDELGAAGRHLRAPHVDRERVFEVLKAAFVQGRLAKEDFDVRVGQVLTSRSFADLAVCALPSRPTNSSCRVGAWPSATQPSRASWPGSRGPDLPQVVGGLAPS